MIVSMSLNVMHRQGTTNALFTGAAEGHLLFDTCKFIGNFEKMLGKVISRGRTVDRLNQAWFHRIPKTP